MLKPVTIPLNTFRLLKSIALLLFFTAFLAVVPFLATAEKPMGIGIAITYGFLVFIDILALISAVRQLIYRKDALVLHKDGFTYGVPLLSRRTILWRDVKSMRHVYLGRDSFVAVSLHDEKPYLAGLNWAQRLNAKLCSLVLKAPITVQTLLLQDRELVAELMEGHHKQAVSGDTLQAH